MKKHSSIFLISIILLVASCKKDDDNNNNNNAVVAPVLGTMSLGTVLQSTASFESSITSDGGASITSRGVCYNTSPNPTLSNDHTSDGSGTGNFTSNATGLSPATSYYACAYATNSSGTSYSNEINFTTLINNTIYTPGGGVTDIDGNSYSSIIINGQEWMKENLKVTHYRNGDPITHVTDSAQWINQTTEAYCDYDNDASNVSTYGRLYNWWATTDSRNIAPLGWHVATDVEWDTLVNQFGGSAVAGIELKEAGTAHWINSNNGTNSSGFTALPGGLRYGTSLQFLRMDSQAYFWTSSGTIALYRYLTNYSDHVYSGPYDRHGGLSVRCIKD